MAKCEIKIERDEAGFYRLTGFDSLNLKSTLYCGQAFRWKRIDGIDTAVVRGKLLRLEQEGDTLIVHPPVDEETIKIVVEYLRLEESHKALEDELRAMDDIMAKAVEYSSGLKLVDQEPFECLISYIISANNSIPLISRAVNLLSQKYGKKIEFAGEEYYAFPTPQALSEASEEDIFNCKTGFRAAYIKAAVERILCGEIDLDSIKSMDYPEAKEKLKALKGVGDKVADCVLLFSMSKFEAFPVDIWVDRIVRNLYLDGNKMSKQKVREWGENKFGALAGYAQEYLFTYAREVVPEILRAEE